MRYTNRFAGSLLVLFAMCLITLHAFADEKHVHGDKKPAAAGGMPDMSKMSPEQQKQMEMMMKYATPGAEHERLVRQFGGTWDAECTTTCDPNSSPQVTKGTMINKPVLGGRFLHQSYKGELMGQPFEGAGTIGYDNSDKKYTGTWIDSMSTGTMFSKGDYDESSKTYTMTSEMSDPMSGNMVKVRQVIAVLDDDHHTLSMYCPGPDGKEAKMMEIKYTRQK